MAMHQEAKALNGLEAAQKFGFVPDGNQFGEEQTKNRDGC
jgi:hypothetical protein